MSLSGDSDTESLQQTLLEEWKCNICSYIPSHEIAYTLWEQCDNVGPYLLRLPNGEYYVRCRFADCQRYFHLTCVHPTFPDEALNFSHFEDLQQNGIHCSCCEPGHEISH